MPAALDGTACGVWLSGDAPERFRQGLELNARPSPEERPFDNKYAGRRIHEQLLAEAKTCLAKDNLDVAVPDAATAAAAASSSAVSTSAEQTALQGAFFGGGRESSSSSSHTLFANLPVNCLLDCGAVARTVVAVLLYHIGINKVETEELGAGEKDLNQVSSPSFPTLHQCRVVTSNLMSIPPPRFSSSSVHRR